MSSRLIYFSRRLLALAAIAIPLLSFGGCRVWNYQKDFWSVERYRDERARDIDDRLSKNAPIVNNPF